MWPVSRGDVLKAILHLEGEYEETRVVERKFSDLTEGSHNNCGPPFPETPIFTDNRAALLNARNEPFSI